MCIPPHPQARLRPHPAMLARGGNHARVGRESAAPGMVSARPRSPGRAMAIGLPGGGDPTTGRGDPPARLLPQEWQQTPPVAPGPAPPTARHGYPRASDRRVLRREGRRACPCPYIIVAQIFRVLCALALLSLSLSCGGAVVMVWSTASAFMSSRSSAVAFALVVVLGV